MAEPLAVDPARLIAAGSKLSELVFPEAPAPIAATGSDSVSAAINETMPGIESLVSEGLPGVTAALKRTATSMSTAADIYTNADQSLGEALQQHGFDSDGPALAAGAMGGVSGASATLLGVSGAPTLSGPAAQLAGAPAAAVSQVSQAVGAQAEALAPRVAATVPQAVQLAPQASQFAQQASPIAQTISQSAQQGASSGSQAGGAAPAQLVDDTKLDDAKKDEEEDPNAQAQDEGAAAQGTPAVTAI
jgi:hypothetical protein